MNDNLKSENNNFDNILLNNPNNSVDDNKIKVENVHNIKDDIFAKDFPEWDLLPLNTVIRRVNRK